MHPLLNALFHTQNQNHLGVARFVYATQPNADFRKADDVYCLMAQICTNHLDNAVELKCIMVPIQFSPPLRQDCISIFATLNAPDCS